MTPKPKNISQKCSFEPVEDPLVLEPVLAKRLPTSLNVYNIMRHRRNWKSTHKWFILKDVAVDDVWVAVTYFGMDFGHIIVISRPPNASITTDIQSAFSKCDFIDWGESYMFSCIDTTISSMISDISIREKGNWTQVHPCYLYYVDREDALKLEIPTGDFEVKPMGTKEGAEFLVKTWKYGSEKSYEYVEKCLQRNVSAGVYVNDKIVAGVIVGGHGLISMLYASEDFRGKGYGRLAMHRIMKECAENIFIPGCMVEQRNVASNTFQEKIGFKVAAEVDFIIYTKTAF